MQIRSEEVQPAWIHSHYADAGYAAVKLSRILGVPFVHTGHSLGRRKLEKLPASGMNKQQAMERFRFRERFAAEETTLERAALVICSSMQEKEDYRDYEHAAQARYVVLPPGTDPERFFPYYQERRGDEQQQARVSLKASLDKFLEHPDRPLIVAMARADAKKNLAGLIEAYGSDLQLQAMANLAVFAGNRDDILVLPPGQSEVLREILLLMDRFDLYGKLAIPKRHDTQWEAPELYRLAAESRGVFVNVAFTEPFGLTLVEAAACGLPVLATNQGGPVDIVGNLRNGILVDPRDTAAMQAAMREIVSNQALWRSFSNSGIRNLRRYYSWQSHVTRYVEELNGAFSLPKAA
jgi:sucrose-phosphate synthase